MAILTFSFDTGGVDVQTIVDGICDAFNYQAVINNIPNPQTKAQFAKDRVKHFIIDAVKNAAITQAVNAAASNITPIVLS